MSINEMIGMQKDLMDKVPHELKADAFIRMVASVKVVDALLRYLNSTGHKPWRPIPLSDELQANLIAELKDRIGLLDLLHTAGVSSVIDTQVPKVTLTMAMSEHDIKHYQRQLTSAFGIIEETIEYLDTLLLGKPDRASRLEELVDILFFWLEELILSGFTWEQVVAEYDRKWKVNMERYSRAEVGDYSWDKRSESKL
jgi:phosphoribosyl-ATP pyrophosphohydrolase